MRLRMLKDHRHYRTGQVVEVPGGVGSIWVARKLAVEVKPRRVKARDKMLRMQGRPDDAQPSVMTK